MKPLLFAAALAAVSVAGTARAHECDEKQTKHTTRIHTPERSVSVTTSDEPSGKSRAVESGTSTPQQTDQQSSSSAVGGSGYSGYSGSVTDTPDSSRSSTLQQTPSEDLSQQEARSSSSTTTTISPGSTSSVGTSRVAMGGSGMPSEGRSFGVFHNLRVQAGAGIEGYFGDMNDLVAPGPMWNVRAAADAGPVLGVELGYTGAANEVRESRFGTDPSSGADIVRNGGDVVATLSLPESISRFRPYALAGIGINRFTARGSTGALGFSSDTAGAIPLGVGVKTHLGALSADLRLDYNVGLGERFAPTTGATSSYGAQNTDRYQGLLQVGAQF